MRRLLLTALSLLMACASAAAGGKDIVIRPDRKVAEVSPLFWGTNFLFWIEDDAALADGSLEKSLRELPCRILRYPGGTVADNFHWETNMLDNPAMFPYEQGDPESDFEEFMAFCGRVGAEPMLVVNTQSWAVRKDIEGGAAEAARWVKYCKDKGYHVRYWEIGNETYWHPVMTAREYGRLVKVYSRAMKAVDPDIIVSANGPWDIKASGDKERIDSTLWEPYRLEYAKLHTQEQYLAFKDRVKESTAKPWTVSKDKWWKGVIEECADDIDMVSVHWYFMENNVRHIDNKINELMDFLRNKTGKDYLLCMSEYNCNAKDDTQRILGLAESLGRFLSTGAHISCFWPFRIGGHQSRTMLDISNGNPRYPYQLFQMLQKELPSNLVECSGPEGFYTYAGCDGDRLFAVVSNMGLESAERVSLKTNMKLKGKDIQVRAWTPEKGTRIVPSECIYEKKGDCIVFTMEPHTFITIGIK